MCLFLAGAVQTPVDAFKKDVGSLQSEIEKLVNDTGARTMLAPRAGFVEGYGVVVSLEVALEPPRNLLFPGTSSGGAASTDVKKSMSDRQKTIKDQLTSLMKRSVVSMESIGVESALTVVIHLLNTNPGLVPDLPRQLVFTVKKASPQMVSYKEI